MYKVHFENRFIIISPEPDRVQKYGLFHKFHDTNELYKLISSFQSDKEISSINIYGPDIKFIWKIFRIYFTEVEAAGGFFSFRKMENGICQKDILNTANPLQTVR